METEKGNKFDPGQWMPNFLAYEAHMRLMVLLFILGLVAGLSYFVYSRAVYSSRGLVKVRIFSAVADEKGNQRTIPLHAVRRQLLGQLNERYMQTQAAVRAGFIAEGSSFGEMRDQAFPAIRVGVLDEDYLEITTTSYFPEGVRVYAQALVDEYLEKQEELRRQYREDAIARYSKELVEVRNKLENKLTAKLKFEEDNSIADVIIRQEELSSVPVDLVMARNRFRKMTEIRRDFVENREKLDVVAQLALLNRLDKIKENKVGKMIRNTPDGQAPVKMVEEYGFDVSASIVVKPDMVEGVKPWRELEKKKRLLEEKLEAQSKIYGDEHPIIKGIRAEIAEVTTSMEAELEVEVKRFELEYNEIQEEIKMLESKLPAYHKVTREYDQQRLDYDLLDKSELAWDKAHKEISERIAGLEFGEGRKSAELAFAGFTELRDKDPISPNKLKLMIMGIVLGLGMAVGVPFMIRMFDDSAATLQQLEGATGLTGIGVVPLTDKEDLEKIVRSPALGAAVPNRLLETFRVIRSNIILHPGRDGKSQVVMVTSACPGEGKTTQAANLAWAFSSMGEKTLLVDCDLRRGRVHTFTGLDNEAGMTALLTGQVAETEVMQAVGEQGLTVIPRGPVVAGTTEILCQARFAELMEGWRKKYHRIIMDTPPVLGLSETVSLQRLADGVVLVVKAETTGRKDVARAVENLRKGGAHFFGFVLNRIDLSQRANYFNYYYYSAHYYDDFIDSEDEEGSLRVQGAGV